jgi:beta-lactamase superfamily II metal-dependent hydrolase
MINYGSAPKSGELEVALFGPGYGESIAVHLGEGNWMLVDSCLDPATREPAAETYLNQIGVDPSAVRVIVASHWHDDHVRGLARLVQVYSAAELHISSVFADSEALAFLATFNGNAAPKLTRGTGELFRAVSLSKNTYHVHQRSSILDISLPSMSCRVVAAALSPVQAAFAEFIARMANYIPRTDKNLPIGHAPGELRPNMEAVVLHIDWADDAVLLGSDLEEHSTYGWTAVLSDAWSSGRRPAAVYKVAHHGSDSAHTQALWTSLLQQHPIACMTPFNNGNQHLPTEQDRQRIRAITPHAFITSDATRKPSIQSDKLKRLGDLCTGLTRVNAGFGAVRVRKQYGAGDWTVERFGAAHRL